MCNGIAPDPPQNLREIDVQTTNVTLQWDIPWIFNGELKSFNIYAIEIGSLNNETCCDTTKSKEIPFTDERLTYNHTVMVFLCISNLSQFYLT